MPAIELRRWYGVAQQARAEARLRSWARLQQARLAAFGCDFELVAPRGVSFATPPRIEPSRQGPGHAGGGRGSLKLVLGEGVHLDRVLIEVATGTHNVLALGDGSYAGFGVRLMAYGGELRFGRHAHLRDGVKVKSSGRLVAGEDIHLSYESIVHCDTSVTLHDRVGFAERVTLIDSDHDIDGSSFHHQAQPVRQTPVVMEPNTFVAANAIILRGAHIGPNCVVGAGAVVRAGEYPGGHLIIGSPATARKRLPGAAEPGAGAPG